MHSTQEVETRRRYADQEYVPDTASTCSSAKLLERHQCILTGAVVGPESPNLGCGDRTACQATPRSSTLRILGP